MKLRFLVSVDVDPQAVEGRPMDVVVRDEIRSNLESVEYVRGCEVVPVRRALSDERTR